MTACSRYFVQYIANFNSHAHVERDIKILCNVDLISDFNSHAHVERDGRTLSWALSAKYFNSHAHVERDTLNNALLGYVGISTHTLTWSVTCR